MKQAKLLPAALSWWQNSGDDMAQALVAAGVTLLRCPGFEQDELGLWHSPDGGAPIAWFNDSEGNLLSFTQQG